MREEFDYGLKRYSHISLLWEKEEHKDVVMMSDSDMSDVLFNNVLQTFENLDYKASCHFLQELPVRLETTIYRQKIMEDFLNHVGSFQQLMALSEESHRLLSLSKFAFEKEATVYNLMKRLGEVENIRGMLNKTYQILKAMNPESEGLKAYYGLVDSILHSDIFESFVSDIDHIDQMDDGIKSLKIGLNLNEYLQPEEAILLELSDEEFKYTRLNKKMGYIANNVIKELKSLPRRWLVRDVPLYPDALNRLERTIEPATLQLIRFCDQFTDRLLQVLSVLYHELPYYGIGIEMASGLKEKQHHMCFASFSTDFDLRDIYNLEVGLRKPHHVMTYNHFVLKAEEKICIITGANLGGKTTITQAVAQVVWLGKLGFPIPCRQGTIPYVDQLFFHFPKEEKNTDSYGRLGEECYRFKEIFNKTTKESLVLMNESFSGTSHFESLEIAIESIRALNQIEAFVLMNTHLHELLDGLEAYVSKEKMKSYIAGKDMKKAPFDLVEGRPLGKSYAMEIAKRHGMSYEQLTEG